MQTDTQINVEQYNADDYIDLAGMAGDYLRCLKKYWFQFLLLLIAAVAVTVAYFNWSYVPSYTAKITYAVNKTGDTGIDASIAKWLSNAVPVISVSSEFTEELLEKVEKDSVNMGYWLSSQYTDGANLFSVSVNSNNYKNANMILDSFERIYPSWADKSNGSVELEIVDKSEASAQPTNPYSLLKYVFYGFAAGCALAFCFATFSVLTIKTVRKESDMKKITNKSCITRIPEVKLKKREKSKKSQLLISNKRINWGFKQSLLAAQSRIDNYMSRNGNKVLLITSTIPQEGKSMMAVNLALASVQNGKKTVIIDGDMRNPSVAKLFGFDGEMKGLSDYFAQKADPDEIIINSGKLSVIHAGTNRGGVSGILSDVMMQDLMRYLRKAYDVIIIDTPPSHMFSDAAILSEYADSVVYIVRNDSAEIKEIKDGISSFIQNQKLLGYIINRSQGGFSTYGKYGYSKYGHYGKYKRYINVDESSMNTEDSL